MKKYICVCIIMEKECTSKELGKVISIDEENESVLVEHTVFGDNQINRYSMDEVCILYDINADMFLEKEEFFNEHGTEEFLKRYYKKDILEFPCSVANIRFESIKDLENYIKRHHERY